MKLKTNLVLILFLSFTIFCKCTVLFDTLKKTIENLKGDTLDELSRATLESKIKDSIFRASELLNLENFENSDCEPDFSRFCPEKWTYLGDGIHCKSEPGYNGSCNKIMDFSNKTPLEKLALSRDCSFSWPCKSTKPDYIPDKINQCPKFWLTKGEICTPHESYLGICDNLSIEELENNKEELTLKCGLQWEDNMFKVENLLDLSENCPLGYSGGEVCTPSDKFFPKFQGPIRFHNRQDKLLKTNLYNLSWNFKMSNEEYLDEKCPFQWSYDPKTDLCLAPPTYKGPCQIRVDFSKMTKKVKNIWSNVCLVDFYPGEEIVEGSRKGLGDKIYRDGPLESMLKIIKRRKVNKKDTPTEILRKQLNELYKLRKKSTDDNFLSTLQYTIENLERKIASPSFLQISSNIATKKYKCPYNWDEYENVCIAPKTYQTFAPNCYTIISRFSRKFDDSCRVQFNDDFQENEDFVREYCPSGWKFEEKLDGRILRRICRPKNGQINYNFTQCGTKVDFTNVSPEFKRMWAYACKVKFPPKSNSPKTKCKENFYRKCPYGWKETSDSCLAPKSYVGPCGHSVKFTEISTSESKKDFSQKCQAFWDCLDNCEKDYSKPCPKGWNLSNDTCTATYKYDFPCKPQFKIPKKWNTLAKQEFEFVCQAYWECKS